MEPAAELNFLTTLLPVATIVFTITIGVVLLNQHFRKNLYRQMLEQEGLKNKHHHDLLRSSIEVQEVERKRIAQDLHDEIGVLLTTSKLYFNQLKAGQSEEQLQQIKDKMKLLFDEMMANIRRISHDLRPIVLENLGLVEAIDSLCDKLAEAGITFDFKHHVTIELPKEAELNLYRIIQELIGNTLKHAQANRIFIDIKETGHTLQLHYKDDGVGFSGGSQGAGLGMKSIESRLNLLHGKMQWMDSGKGVHFFMEIDTRQLNNHE
jgi:signal transduction histidine kinase